MGVAGTKRETREILMYSDRPISPPINRALIDGHCLKAEDRGKPAGYQQVTCS